MADDPKAMEEGGLKDRGIGRDVSSSDLEDHGIEMLSLFNLVFLLVFSLRVYWS